MLTAPISQFPDGTVATPPKNFLAPKILSPNDGIGGSDINGTWSSPNVVGADQGSILFTSGSFASSGYLYGGFTIGGVNGTAIIAAQGDPADGDQINAVAAICFVPQPGDLTNMCFITNDGGTTWTTPS